MSENLIKLISEEKIFPIIRCKDPVKTVEIAKEILASAFVPKV